MAMVVLTVVAFALVLSVTLVKDSRAQSSPPCSTTSVEPAAVAEQAIFYPVRVGPFGSFRYRDIEFQWDAQYDLPGTLGLSATDLQTLNRLGITLAEDTGHNPFGANLSDIHLIHEYFRVDSTSPYVNDPNAPYGIVAGHELSYPKCEPTCPAIPEAVPFLQRRHVDHYLVHPNRGKGAQYPPGFFTAKEDSSTGLWMGTITGSDSVWTVWFANAIQTEGYNPTLEARVDLDGTGWTRPGGTANVAFNHEFQHSLPKPVAFETSSYVPIDEIFGTGAESVGGNMLNPGPYDVSYTANLFSQIQQQHKRLFASYLAFNFRGTDTTATLNGFQDDLLSRWARTDRHLHGLRPLLSDAVCGECSQVLKPYFHPGGVPLDDHSRLQLLIHNWRVANYVNNSELDHGQYGYPPQFGFTPKYMGSWQDRDGSVADNVVAIPPELVVKASWAQRETTIVGTRYSSASTRGQPDHAYPMIIDMFGSEYWVVRADPSVLDTTARALVVRVSAEHIFRCLRPDGPHDGRLIASVVGYSVPSESLSTGQLWAHPEWAVEALAPAWVDVDSVARDLEFQLPGFGSALNAVVIVISFADGPSQMLSSSEASGGTVGSHARLKYRLNIALREGHYIDPNPSVLAADTTLVDQFPAWSPAGDELGFIRRDAATGNSAVYRRPGSGGAPVMLGTATNETLSDLDWSPRGDWLAFSRSSTTEGAQQIWAINRVTQEQRQLTSGENRVDEALAFEPHGQRIACLRAYVSSPPEPQTLGPFELRRVNLDGTEDQLIAMLPFEGARSLRWAPDGDFLYFTMNGAFHGVAIDEGTVTARAALFPGAQAFDFHRGRGAIVAGEAGVSKNAFQFSCMNQPGVPFVRVALRDTLANDTQARFYRTGTEFFTPRWSPDGTRIAYASNQNTANVSNDRDLFVGQVSFNRAPQFNFLYDQAIAAGPTFELELMATDPDGEALTYDAPARYLPPGAVFHSSPHRFVWTNPGPEMSEHYVVFRVMDGSGGVATQVVRFMVTSPAIADLNPTLVGGAFAWLNWTAPGTVGGPSALEYDLRHAPFPITDLNFEIAYRAWDLTQVSAPGTLESYQVQGLQECTALLVRDQVQGPCRQLVADEQRAHRDHHVRGRWRRGDGRP